jgi:hypothetical protein
MDQHQQDLFFLSNLSNQRANQVGTQTALAMERAALVSGFMAQGHDPAKAEALADAYLRPRIQQAEGLTFGGAIVALGLALTAIAFVGGLIIMFFEWLGKQF